MTKPRDIRQTVRLPASPDKLFESYLDPARHAAISGQPVHIAPEPGGEFRAFDGVISGRIVALVPKRLIVQTWRASHWKKDDIDSVLVLAFSGDRAYGQIDLVHVNVADHDFKDYWTPWRKYLGQG